MELLGQNCINTEAFLKASIYIQVCNLDMYLDPDWYQMIEESQVWPQLLSDDINFYYALQYFL